MFYCWPLVQSYADDVIVTGVLTAKWSPDMKDVRCDLEPVLVANYVRYNEHMCNWAIFIEANRYVWSYLLLNLEFVSFRRINEIKLDIEIPEDIILQFKNFWSDFKDTPLKGKKVLLDGN